MYGQIYLYLSIFILILIDCENKMSINIGVNISQKLVNKKNYQHHRIIIIIAVFALALSINQYDIVVDGDTKKTIFKYSREKKQVIRTIVV